MRRTQLAGLLCLLMWCFAAPAAQATHTVLVPASPAGALAHAARSTSPSCSNDPLTGSLVTTLAISGTLAFLDDYNALTILDVSDPARPVCRSHLIFSGTATSVQVRGERAYLSVVSPELTANTLKIIDIHDPDNPTILGTYNAPYAADLSINGNLVYISDQQGLEILDVSNPAAIVRVNTYNQSGPTRVEGNRLYLQIGGHTLDILDITDPAHPVRLGGFYEGTGLTISGWSFSGNRAYLVKPPHGVEVLDVSNPNNPILIGNYTNMLSDNGVLSGIEVIGDIAYIAGTKFEIYDVSSPDQAVRLGSYDPPGFSYALRVVGNLAYIGAAGAYGAGDYGFEIVDVANKVNPFLRGWFRNGNTGRFFYMQAIRR